MSTLTVEAEKYIFNLLNSDLKREYVYHDLAHTQRVVDKAKLIIESMNLDDVTIENLMVACWFHDAGFTKGSLNHEKESVKIASKFLKDHEVSNERIAKISEIILATEMDYVPKNDIEKVIRDADCAHLGSKNFENYTELLRKEWELAEGKVYTESEWINLNIDFLTKKHQFYTNYSLKKWSKNKGRNIADLLKSQKKIEKETKKFNQKNEELKIKKDKVDLPERGIETMFRVALRNHITLSDIADTKANILLSVNPIIVSLALSNLIPKLDNPSNDYLVIPSLIFIFFTVTSIVLSVLATRPNVTQGKFSKEDVANKKVNLLFFGNFHQMKLPEFEWAMHEMMKDRDYLYGSLTKDLYFLGLVLNRKYSLLRTTYTVFMIGIIISVTAFAIAFMMQERGVILA